MQHSLFVFRASQRIRALVLFAPLLSFAFVLAVMPSHQAMAAELAVGVQDETTEASKVVYQSGGIASWDENGNYSSTGPIDTSGENEGELASIGGYVSGEVAFDKDSGVLTITDLHAEILQVRPGAKFTLNLQGENVLSSGIGEDETQLTKNVWHWMDYGLTQGNLTIDGAGSLVIDSAFRGIAIGDGEHSSSLTIKGGRIDIKNPVYYGINVDAGNFSMTGGTLNITGACKGRGEDYLFAGIRVTSLGKKWGKASVTGGSLSVATVKGKNMGRSMYSPAIEAEGGMKNKAKCLKKVVGALPVGASFISQSNEYTIANKNSGSASNIYVKLVKFNQKKTKVTIKTSLKFGKTKYSIGGFGTKAFSTAAGKKLKSLTCKCFCYTVEKKAFSNTKSLTRLRFTNTGTFRTVKDSFSGCGKNKGKSLQVIMKSKWFTSDSMKKLLTSRGLSKKATVTVVS